MTSHKSIMVWGDYGPDSITGQWSANTYDRDDAVEYVPAAIDAAPQAVVMKPLAWVKHPSADIWRVDTIIGTYKVFGTGPSPSWDFDGLTEKSSHVCKSVEAGFSAAQAHHDANILSCINLTPASPLSAAVAYARAADAVRNRGKSEMDVKFLGATTQAFYEAYEIIRALSAEIPAADLLKAALALPEVVGAEKALKDALTYIDKGHHGMARNIIAAALARLKGSQP